ncbi:Na(+)/H(+) antiporter NhaA [Mycolicibacter heraklionensis]|uniref:Na(+)/H(+) antiporter NhaA n=1 Tax=Mycolicibacter heraklionensis TaxID=512402 RepID=A0ABR5FGP2_9MYCO|nr:Na+/H+ antiporter NhaA [Mycolicibacter heraklionensis]KLO29641.1 Na(+)/H(+) antiporter NhaA [Mycolicibacter heraklionensis]
MTSGRPPLFGRGSSAEARRLADVLRKETVGGALLLLTATVAIGWANSPWSAVYYRLGDLTFGPRAWHLNLPVSTWAADGLLAVFFFMVGLELKYEVLAGDLRDPRRAALPVVAAVGGMVMPAAVFVAVNIHTGGGALRGWAIPTATDIAFALAVLAVISSHLPSALRTFLLTLAVVDDLLAVTVIAVFYTDDLNLAALALALVPLALFAVAARRFGNAAVLLPLAAATWYLVHESGVHATIAGVLLGLTVPVRESAKRKSGRRRLDAKDLEHRIRPLSAGLAVPVFAFFAAGVTFGGLHGLAASLRDPVAIGIVAGLVIGKAVGIAGAAALTAALTRAELDTSLKWIDVVALALLGGIGFTIALLIGDLAFADPVRREHVKLGVLIGTLTAALLAAVLLTFRDRAYARDADSPQSFDLKPQ